MKYCQTKKLVVFLLILCLLALSACGGSDSHNDKANENSNLTQKDQPNPHPTGVNLPKKTELKEKSFEPCQPLSELNYSSWGQESLKYAMTIDKNDLLSINDVQFWGQKTSSIQISKDDDPQLFEDVISLMNGECEIVEPEFNDAPTGCGVTLFLTDKNGRKVRYIDPEIREPNGKETLWSLRKYIKSRIKTQEGQQAD